jgi:hypothetical protein
MPARKLALIQELDQILRLTLGVPAKVAQQQLFYRFGLPLA